MFTSYGRMYFSRKHLLLCWEAEKTLSCWTCCGKVQLEGRRLGCLSCDLQPRYLFFVSVVDLLVIRIVFLGQLPLGYAAEVAKTEATHKLPLPPESEPSNLEKIFYELLSFIVCILFVCCGRTFLKIFIFRMINVITANHHQCMCHQAITKWQKNFCMLCVLTLVCSLQN